MSPTQQLAMPAKWIRRSLEAMQVKAGQGWGLWVAPHGLRDRPGTPPSRTACRARRRCPGHTPRPAVPHWPGCAARPWGPATTRTRASAPRRCPHPATSPGKFLPASVVESHSMLGCPAAFRSAALQPHIHDMILMNIFLEVVHASDQLEHALPRMPAVPWPAMTEGCAHGAGECAVLVARQVAQQYVHARQLVVPIEHLPRRTPGQSITPPPPSW